MHRSVGVLGYFLFNNISVTKRRDGQHNGATWSATRCLLIKAHTTALGKKMLLLDFKDRMFTNSAQ